MIPACPTNPAALAQAAELSDQPPWIIALLVMGILLVTASMMIGLRNRKQRGSTQITAREQLERVKQREGLKRDLEALAVEIEEMARRIGAQLDNKAARIETLLAQADAAATRLEQARMALLQPASNAPPDARPGAKQPTTVAASGGDRLTSDVVRLHAEGMSAADIARAVGEDAGKIELILALRKV